MNVVKEMRNFEIDWNGKNKWKSRWQEIVIYNFEYLRVIFIIFLNILERESFNIFY